VAIEIVVLGDIHGEAARLARTLDLVRAARPALVLLAGDVGVDPPWGAERETGRADHDASVRRVLATVHDALGGEIAFVPGNHDLRDAVADPCGVNCDQRRIEAAGLSIVGLGGAGPAKFGFPYEWTEKEADLALRRTIGGDDARIDVLLSHTPPQKTPLDRTHRGEHVGSRAVRRWIARRRPALFVCGHIHEAWGASKLDGVPCLNAGALGVPHEQEIAWRIEWDEGQPTRVRSLRRQDDGDVEERVW
jgi:Icc-related predicted phosphoesterase